MSKSIEWALKSLATIHTCPSTCPGRNCEFLERGEHEIVILPGLHSWLTLMKYTKSTIFFFREKCIIFSSNPISFYDFYTWQLPRSVLHSPRVPHAKAMIYDWHKHEAASKKQISDDPYKTFPNTSPNLAFQKTTWPSFLCLTKSWKEKSVNHSLKNRRIFFAKPGVCRTIHQTIKSHRPSNRPTHRMQGHRMGW